MSSSQPQQTFYIVLPPQPEEAPSYARQISRLMQKDEAAIREQLASPTYQLLLRYARRDNAEGFCNQLNAFGVRAFFVSDTSLSGSLFIWMRQANKGAGGLALQDFSGQPLYSPFEDIVGVFSGTVRRTDGSTTTLIDLHRKSTPITPRIDASLFDFASVTGGDNTADAFIQAIYDPSNVSLNQEFDVHGEAFGKAARKALATFPGQFAPSAKELPTEYDPDVLRAFDCFSYIAREDRVRIMEG